MKKALLMLLAIMLMGFAWAKNFVNDQLTINEKTKVDAAANQLDAIFENTLISLKQIASTEEAQNGDWKAIKRDLSGMAAEYPGVYFFVLPDGNYYTIQRDYTNLNLSDRPYFKSLFAGNAVKGFTVYSRSTGKKSALTAMPIIVGNKVIGALGASIFLDDLHAKLNKEFALPDNYLWFAIDSKGNDVLDKDSDFIFMNTLTQGSKSLHDEVLKALKNKSGIMKYEIGGIVRYAHYQKLPNMDWWMVLARAKGKEVKTPTKLKLSLDRFVPKLQKSLDNIDKTLVRSIKRNKLNVDNEGDVRKFINSIFNSNPKLVNVGFIDSKGFLRYLEPRDYKNYENADINYQENVKDMLKNHKPLMSDSFMAVENFLAVAIEQPMFDKKKNFVGCISALIRPELLIESLIKKNTTPKDYELWVIQTDGKVIYDQDKEEIGKMLFSDPMYAEYESLQVLGKKVISEPNGKGSYIFLSPGSKEKAIKNVIWQTVKLHGKEWRVALAYRPYGNK